MRRLVPLLGVVLALACSSTAAADNFRVVRPHQSAGTGTVTFASGGPVVAFTESQNGPMSFAALRGIWEAAGNQYGIPWEVLAAINKVETNFGQNLGPSSAGAVGWMQFMPSTWARWGIDANGDGVADPNNPTDAIFSAARYLAGCGGQYDIARAVYCYNHSSSYVNDVLSLAAQYSQGGVGGGGLFSSGGLQTLSAGQLHARLTAASSRVHAARAELASVLSQARGLTHSVRRFQREASSATLLSDQLEAHKHAVLIAGRRHDLEVRASRLRKTLQAASAALDRAQNQATSFAANGPQLLSALPAGDSTGVVAIALQYLGVPYVWAGASPVGFDCSGLVQYVFAQMGVALPHNAAAQFHSPEAVSVPRSQLQPGDLVFFNRLDHVGIYIGNGEFVDAPHTGTTVRIDSLSEGWYAANYDGAKRIVGVSLDSFQPSSGSTAFSSDVVYFTH
jgi:cell wall-associated NlpC family hydrolase